MNNTALSKSTNNDGTVAPNFHKKILFSASLGVFLEWYDFMAFAAVATIISNLFFPHSHPSLALLETLGLFGAGMLIRPLGGIIMGPIGDRFGRRVPFIITILLMGLATLGLGLLPTYEKIGAWAPILLLLLRLMQGFAIGGETGSSGVYLIEHAPKEFRATYGSVRLTMSVLAMIILTLQLVFLRHFLSPANFSEWGWRIPFLVSIIILAVSVKMRFDLHESPSFELLKQNNNVAKTPIRECLRTPMVRKGMLLIFFTIGPGFILFYVSQMYASIFLKVTIGINPSIVDILFLTSSIFLIPITLLAGWYSDRIGRRPIFLIGLLFGGLTLYPIFLGLKTFDPNPNTLDLVLIFCLLLVPLVCYSCIIGPVDAIMTELFPTRLRNSAVTISLNLSSSIISGLSPLVITLINQWLGSPVLGVLYPSIILLIAFIVGYLYLPETKDVELDQIHAVL
jgi:MFS family permease